MRSHNLLYLNNELIYPIQYYLRCRNLIVHVIFEHVHRLRSGTSVTFINPLHFVVNFGCHSRNNSLFVREEMNLNWCHASCFWYECIGILVARQNKSLSKYTIKIRDTGRDRSHYVWMSCTFIVLHIMRSLTWHEYYRTYYSVRIRYKISLVLIL